MKVIGKKLKKNCKAFCKRNRCRNNARKRGYCNTHYSYLRYHNQLGTFLRIPNTGQSKHILYRKYAGMKTRCYNPNEKGYENYGGRGIIVCDRWLGPYGFDNFCADMGQPPTSQHSLDRKDNNGNYTPKNCRWATKSEQASNRRTSVWLELKGKKMIIKDWSTFTGISAATIQKRKYLGWSDEKTLTTPLR